MCETGDSGLASAADAARLPCGFLPPSQLQAAQRASPFYRSRTLRRGPAVVSAILVPLTLQTDGRQADQAPAVRFGPCLHLNRVPAPLSRTASTLSTCVCRRSFPCPSIRPFSACDPFGGITICSNPGTSVAFQVRGCALLAATSVCSGGRFREQVARVEVATCHGGGSGTGIEKSLRVSEYP
jgi:hypothetical protein